jgi:hypothetical protein
MRVLLSLAIAVALALPAYAQTPASPLRATPNDSAPTAFVLTKPRVIYQGTARLTVQPGTVIEIRDLPPVFNYKPGDDTVAVRPAGALKVGDIVNPVPKSN